MNDTNTTIQDLRDVVYRFDDERDWHQFHTPKSLAASIAIEAAELLALSARQGAYCATISSK